MDHESHGFGRLHRARPVGHHGLDPAGAYCNDGDVIRGKLAGKVHRDDVESRLGCAVAEISPSLVLWQHSVTETILLDLFGTTYRQWTRNCSKC